MPKMNIDMIKGRTPEEIKQILDTGLGIERTDKVLVFSLVTRPRTTEQKVNFYNSLVS